MKLFWVYVKMYIPVFIFLNIIGFYGFWKFDIGEWDTGRWAVVFFSSGMAVIFLGFTGDNDKKMKELDIKKLNSEKEKIDSETDYFKAKSYNEEKDYMKGIELQKRNNIIRENEKLKEELKELKRREFMKTTPKTDALQRKGTKWNRWDEEKLEFLYKAGKTTADLSEIFGRSKSSVITRLKLMEIWSGENNV